MTFYIDVFHQKTHLFATEEYQSAANMLKTYTTLQRCLPQAAGYQLRASVRLQTTLIVPQDEFDNAIRKNKGKGFVASLKHKYRKATILAWQLFDLMTKKLT